MPIPKVGGALKGWMKLRLVTNIVQTVVAHQTVNTPSTTTLRMNKQPMPSEKVNRKPEYQRSWKWWTILIKGGLLFNIDDKFTVDGIDFKIEVVGDWTEGGYQFYEAIEGYQ